MATPNGLRSQNGALSLLGFEALGSDMAEGDGLGYQGWLMPHSCGGSSTAGISAAGLPAA